jgi:pSer/pThr/pTyr-binding forkhead associated (FHA) protein
VIDDKSVSRRQAVLKYNNDNLVVYDAGSTNGTYLNGRYVSREEGRHVKDGDRLMFGEVEYAVQMI